MVRVFRWDGKEVFINPDAIMLMERSEKYTDVTLVDGDKVSLSETSYDILSGHTGKKTGPGKAGFDVI